MQRDSDNADSVHSAVIAVGNVMETGEVPVGPNEVSVVHNTAPAPAGSSPLPTAGGPAPNAIAETRFPVVLGNRDIPNQRMYFY